MSESQERRIVVNRGPNYREEINNPQPGGYGPEVHKAMSITDNGEVFVHSLSQDGTVRIVVDKTMEITTGEDNEPGQIDIQITANNGDVSITCEGGMVRLKGRDIVLDAKRDLTLKAGRNLNLRGKAKVDIDGNKIQATGKAGNIIQALGETFTQNIVKKTKIADMVMDVGKSIISRIGR